MDVWQERGLAIAESNTIKKNRLGYQVPSQSGNGSYIVNMDGEPFCTCDHFTKTHALCQHIFAVEFLIQKEQRPDGTEVITKIMKITYGQDWPAYNMAQTHEAERFAELLRDLCQGITQHPQNFGRPRLPLSDVIFAATFKVYSTMSGRRVMTGLKDCQAKGYIDKAPHYNSTSHYLDDLTLTPILKTLIEESSKPLKTVESDFAVDSSGFSTCTYERWFDTKYGKIRSENKWVKVHLMTGVKTNVVTSIEATPMETADAPQLPSLVANTAKNFNIIEVSADKAYSSKRNLQAVADIGGMPYIPFKSYSKGSQGHHEFSNLWERMWHFYSFNQASFLEHYHKRSNAESTLAMIKGKFGTSVRSKTPVAQVNEVLCKVLCHNICVLIQSIYELGLEPTFWAESPVAPKVGP